MLKVAAILLLALGMVVPQVLAQTNPLPGDYNFDGFVDIRDYGVWRAHFGETGPTNCSLLADGNCDGIVDIRDYGIWRENFGRSGPTQTPAVVVVSATPDPRFTSTSIPFSGVSTATPTRTSTPTPCGTPGQCNHLTRTAEPTRTRTPCPQPNPHC